MTRRALEALQRLRDDAARRARSELVANTDAAERARQSAVDCDQQLRRAQEALARRAFSELLRGGELWALGAWGAAAASRVARAELTRRAAQDRLEEAMRCVERARDRFANAERGREVVARTSAARAAERARRRAAASEQEADDRAPAFLTDGCGR